MHEKEGGGGCGSATDPCVREGVCVCVKVSRLNAFLRLVHRSLGLCSGTCTYNDVSYCSKRSCIPNFHVVDFLSNDRLEEMVAN